MGQVDTKGENVILLIIKTAKGGGESWLLLRRGALNRLSLESATTGKALSVNDMTPSLLTAIQIIAWEKSECACAGDANCDFLGIVLQL